MDIKRETYIVVLELDIPAEGTPIEHHSVQNAPDKWVWDRIIDGHDGPPYNYNVKLITSHKVS